MVRMVSDSMGEMAVPDHALYGAQTQRAIENFPISGQTMPEAFVRALLQIKAAAARANRELQCIDQAIGVGIEAACVELQTSDDLLDHFPVDVFQTGSGTSSNMNANEVIASVATKNLSQAVHPNDHVNFGQSSNDVIPSAIHVSAAVALINELMPALQHAIEVAENKAKMLEHVCKTGRTHLMDAMPVTMGQAVGSWGAQLRADVALLESVLNPLTLLAIGGTAVGTGVNTHPEFAGLLCRYLSSETGIQFRPAPNPFPLMSSQDTAVAVSGHLKTVAVSLMKIANDLRWMNAGPLAGLGEITLQPLQPGSSIMPGKVNPVIPEAVAMVAAQVIGNDAAITVAGQSGNFELNVMLPLVASNLISSMTLLSRGSRLLADRAMASFTVNEARLNEALHRNPILATALNPIIGYGKAAEIAKKTYQEDRPVLDVAQEETSLSRDELKKTLDPHKLTRGGL
ncbi:MAG: class II fumarate hydratase [Pseudomonadota bacterium]